MNTASLVCGIKKKLAVLFHRRMVARTSAGEEPALRCDLFNADQMAAHARELAARHRLNPSSSSHRLLLRLDDNENVLRACIQMFAEAARVEGERRIMPAGEWLLDNAYLVEEQIRTARAHLPREYSRELPRLADGPSAGLPRVYDIALQNISHGDGRLDADMLRRFVAAYQEASPLSLGELWAIPIMLRLALVENLRRTAARVTAAWRDHLAAARWADRLLETAARDRKNVVAAVAEMADADVPLTSAFVTEFARRLQGRNAAPALPLTWLEERLAERGLNIGEMIRRESRRQAEDQLSVSNSVSGLRQLSRIDWRDFVEALAIVEQILRRDPAGVYPRMDFETRDNYRHRVERLARRARLSEEQTALAALDLARQDAAKRALTTAEKGDEADIRSHVGHYLAGEGLTALRRRLGIASRRCGESVRLALYLGAALGLTALLAWFPLAVLHGDGWRGAGLAFAAVAILAAASGPALRLLNGAVTRCFPPRFLPRLDYGDGIPATARTVVVIPAIVGSSGEVDDLAARLEGYFLANRDEHLQFGLLTDFRDASQEHEPGDDVLLAHARERIEALNRRYGEGGIDPFFLCHRPRRLNPGERVWMGWERKRGKLCEFTRLLRPGDDAPAAGMPAGDGSVRAEQAFSLIVGNAVREQDPPVRNVITLDADTQLPPDAARRMVGAMSHPLNRPVLNAARRIVQSGYGMLQPLVGVRLPSAARSPYARTFSCDAGVNPYSREVSDVYQDLFAQGSFIGKGIYDVDAFLAVMRGRFPENRVLSHDLLESCYARSGVLCGTRLYEGAPASYSADASRRHRWIRGDWQLLPWLGRRVPLPGGQSERNPLSALSRWKIADNLRRSVIPPALLGALFLGWFGTDRPAVWTFALLIWSFGPALVFGIWTLFRRPAGTPWFRHAAKTWRDTLAPCRREALLLAWLPHEARINLDAAGRTLWRMFVSRRHLLQWTPSHEAERASAASLAEFYRLMWACPVLGCIGVFAAPAGLQLPAVPFFLLWIAGPAIAWRVSRPARVARFVPTDEDTRFLRMLARRTWAFFDRHVGPEDNWLPPDNIQEAPRPAVAHRTSPTNIGLALLAHLAAHDFGYLGAGQLLIRLERMFETMCRLKRHRNHFYNWYDTQSLRPLPPRYISTVDSGNLAGHLLALRSGLLALPDEAAANPRALDGLRDTAAVLDEALENLTASSARNARTLLHKRLDALLPAAFSLSEQTVTALDALVDAARALERMVEHAAGQNDESPSPEHQEVLFWSRTLTAQCLDVREEIAALALPSECLPAGAETPLTWRQLAALRPPARHPADRDSAKRHARLDKIRDLARARLDATARLADLADELAHMDFCFLFDERRNLLSIGYNADDGRRDDNHYDLLASEARLACLVAIARDRLPQESWFALGRQITAADGEPTLLSWSGSMFEYLMPLLVMPAYPASLLDQTCRGAVDRQIAYGRQHGLPWGVSESCYNALDAGLNYQYRAFGVPGLGLRPGLEDDLVLAPYASALALLVNPEEACRNLRRLKDQGLGGRFGMYEAVDYTAARLPRGHDRAVIRAFMAHHQGMTLLALNGFLLGCPMQRRFLADPQIRAVDLLLEERAADSAPEAPRPAASLLAGATPLPHEDAKLRVFTDPDHPYPAVQLLSNGRYHVMIDSAGGGYSRYGDIALTRWREDPVRDDWGFFCYLRDTESGECWSATHQPMPHRPDIFEAVFSETRAEFKVRRHAVDAHTEIAVSPEDNLELRRVRLTNRSRAPRTLEITSYAEAALTTPRADEQHPAFSKLFIETKLEEELQAILCVRRPREAGETRLWLFHLLAAHGADAEEVSYETDRARFLGRWGTPARPAALKATEDGSGRLSGSAGAVLDPVLSIRCRIRLAPGQSAVIDLALGVGSSREDALRQIRKMRDRHLADRVFELAWTHGQVLLHQFNIPLGDARLYQRLAGSIIHADAARRAAPATLTANTRGQNGLWGQSISGDMPIVLLRIHDIANIALLAQMLKAHAYWRAKGLSADLVIWNEEAGGYRQDLHDMIRGLMASGTEAHLLERPGGVFVRSVQRLSREDRLLIEASARVIINDTDGSLHDQIRSAQAKSPLPLAFEPRRPDRAAGQTQAPPPREARMQPQTPTQGRSQMQSRKRSASEPGESLILCSPYGGFTPDGSEYVITLREGEVLPAPWVNVLANRTFGSVVSESGNAYTWAENAHEFRLTPWLNDPVSDAGGEALYLRDEETGRFWSPTPLPCRGRGDYRIRHGFGYTTFEHEEGGIATELRMAVAPEDPVRCAALTIRNLSGRRRPLSVTGYVEWVLGDLRSRSAMHIVTTADPRGESLFARNAYSIDFPGRVAFFAVAFPSGGTAGATSSMGRGAGEAGQAFTCDRAEFIGRNGDLSRPAALSRASLSGRSGAGLDPCAALQTRFEAGPGEECVIVFLLGAAADMEAAEAMIRRCRRGDAALRAHDETRRQWRELLETVQVETPDPAVNVLLNGWLMYQTIAARYMARSGYYQSGGAYGFRDQLQDSMAMIHVNRDAARAHLLLCAAHQFPEGDVQHWWHPPMNRGVRTRCSDDYLWLPLAVSRYVTFTGDQAVLDEEVEYIEGRALEPEEESYYDLPLRSRLKESLYDHCVRALERSAPRGAHGLPLMQAGDWNDGMNRVGAAGRGESVWLGFFLCDVLIRFARVARLRADAAFAARCEEEAQALRDSLETHGWDGAWYRRAYFDDGTPLGSAQSGECRIDSIAQSWSVLSGAAPVVRQEAAMTAHDAHLVREDLGIIRLLAPPFGDRAPEADPDPAHTETPVPAAPRPDPGYIRGYVPGVRENGGQYTHAAIWAVMAHAALGHCERAWELFNMINPIRHSRTAEESATYKTEPYVVAADVYAAPAHAGRGGWTWYTGAAGWMYRLLLESLLGLNVQDVRGGKGVFSLKPLLPRDWPGFSLHLRFGNTRYAIAVQQGETPRIVLDGTFLPGTDIPILADGCEHHVEIICLRV